MESGENPPVDLYASIDVDKHRRSVKPVEGNISIPLEWTGITVPFPRERSVLDFFRAQVQGRPEGLAIKDGERLMSYRDLDLQSNRVANELRRYNLKLEEPVVVFLPASCEFVVSLLGIFKAGGTYLIVDKETPVKRLEFLLADSASRLMLSDVADLEAIQAWPGTAIDPKQILSASNTQGDDSDPGVLSDPDRRAYICYTSGSTGQPKGVEIEHHALTNLVCHYHRHFKLTAKDRTSMLAYVA